MIHTLARYGLLLGAVCSTGCVQDEEPLLVRLTLAPTQPNCKSPNDRTDFSWGASHVRLTILRRQASTSINAAHLHAYGLVCDKLFAGGKAEFNVPQRQGSVSLRVEVFNPADGQLQLHGSREDVDLQAREVEVVLRPAAPSGGVSCSPAMRRSRAFHSATVLPNGQVLIVGGLVTDVAGEGITSSVETREPLPLGAASTVEYLNPVTNEFRVLTPVGNLLPRAFHQAVLLSPSSDAPNAFRVMLIGGVTPANGKPVMWMKVSRSAFPFPLNPDNDAVAATTQVLLVEPGQGPDGDPRITVQPQESPPAVLFPAAGLFYETTPDEIMVAGGASRHVGSYVDPSNINSGTLDNRGFSSPTPAYWMELAGASLRTSVDLPGARVGHAVARLDAERYLVWGGDMDQSPPQTATIITRQGTSASVSSISPAPSSTANTAWHSLTPIGGSDQAAQATGAVLLVGGYQLQDDVPSMRIASAPTATAVQWVEATTPPTIHTVTDAPDPGGYHEATRLADGTVLISGGSLLHSPSDGSLCQVCPVNRIDIYSRTATGVERLTTSDDPRLSIARLGHRAVRLLDNAVLIIGGLTRVQDKEKGTDNIVFLNSTEIYSPRRGGATEDAPLFRDADKDSSESGAVRNQVCPASTRPL